MNNGHARIELPENAQSLEITAGEATISLHRNGQLSLNGKVIISEAETLNQMIGKPISLN